MEKNIVFCFTGTGNSLKVSKDIAVSLMNCDVYNMRDENTEIDIASYKRVGFVFPVYFLGLPLQVRTFVEKLKIPSDFDGYFFSVATYANMLGNAVRQVGVLLRGHGHKLHFASNVKMGDNAIAFYGSKPDMTKLAESYKKDMAVIIPKISSRQANRIGRIFWPTEQYYRIVIPRMKNRDTGFQVSDSCSRCGLCAEVCPVDNINLADGKPEFCHRCEQCMACIQLCPQKAIDYKDKCARRNRYKHPEISLSELRDFQNK